MQRTASSGGLGSANENQAEVKLETTGSLIDFDADPKPSPAVAQAQQKTVAQSVVQPASSANDNNWASFDLAPQVKVSQTSSNLNTLETVFSQLSVPASVPGQVSGIPSGAGAPVIAPATNVNVLPGGGLPVASVGHTPFSVFSAAAPAAPAVSGFATFPSANAPATAPGVTPLLPVSVNAGNSFSMQHQPPLFPTAGGQFTASQFTPPVAGSSNNQVVFILCYSQVPYGFFVIITTLLKHMASWPSLALAAMEYFTCSKCARATSCTASSVSPKTCSGVCFWWSFTTFTCGSKINRKNSTA